MVKEYCSVSLDVSSCNVINCKTILLPPNSYILSCTLMMWDLQGLCDYYNVFMTLCNIRHTESVAGHTKTVRGPVFGPRWFKSFDVVFGYTHDWQVYPWQFKPVLHSRRHSDSKNPEVIFRIDTVFLNLFNAATDYRSLSVFAAQFHGINTITML